MHNMIKDLLRIKETVCEKVTERKKSIYNKVSMLVNIVNMRGCFVWNGITIQD